MTLQTPFFRRKSTRRTLFALLILLLLTLVASFIAAINLRHDLQTSLPQLDGTLPVAGLAAPVTVTRDEHGVPSIHASTLDDLLFAQGYITASDRLFQMDALRRHGAGELAELLGSSLVSHDRQQRYLQLRASADRAISVLPPDQLHQLQIYANGVNAFITTHTNPNTLPVEFHLLHYTPRPWLPRDSLLISLVMAQDLATRFPAKLNREALATHLPVALLPDLYPVGSWRDHPPTQTPTDLTTPTDTIGQIPLDRSQSLIEPCHKPGCPIHPRHLADEWASHKPQGPATTPTDLLAVSNALRQTLCDGCRFGSNNWAVAGAHTASGAPLLSNDMHLGLTAPDIWYEAALHAEGSAGLNVTGFTLPGIPFVVVGRNPFIAWGFTNSGADVQDVLIEHLRGKGNQTEFEHPDGTWSAVQHQAETIHIRASRDLTLDILLTTHALGDKSIPTPIISPLYPTERRAISLAWTIYDASTITSPLYAMNTATDAAALVAAASNFASVSQNLVFADAHHIGYHLLGRIPVRGPATQRPRPAAPFILPDNTPPEDDEDESGSLHYPSQVVPSTFVCHPEGTCISPPRNARLASGTPSPLPVLGRHPRAGGEGPPHFLRATQTFPNQTDTTATQLPIVPTTPYTIGSPISSVPIDALDQSQIWSGYIPYDQLPSVLDPTSGLIATANSRIATDTYPYFLANDWVDAYRTERIYTLLQNRSGLSPADMLAIQTDTHSDLDLLVAQRLAYALDHAAVTKSDPHLKQAADLLRNFDGNMSPTSPAAAIVAATREQLWPMLLAPQLRPAHFRDTDAPKPHKLSPIDISELLDLYTWDEKITALEQILQHTPARWLPRSFPTWNDFLATAVQRALKNAGAPANLTTWTYGTLHPVEIPHPLFGSTGLVSHLLGIPTGTGLHPNGGDGTTIKQTGLHFGPSERFTADLADPEDTHANITTGESGNPASPWFLDQFPAWLNGTTLTLPLSHPTTTHTLTLTPK
jgi:penicillin amidase